MGLVVGFRQMHFRGMSAGGVCSNVRGDGILPETEAYENMGRHVNGVSGVRGDGGVAAGSVEGFSRAFRGRPGVGHVMRYNPVVWRLLEPRVLGWRGAPA